MTLLHVNNPRGDEQPVVHQGLIITLTPHGGQLHLELHIVNLAGGWLQAVSILNDAQRSAIVKHAEELHTDQPAIVQPQGFFIPPPYGAKQ